MSNKSKEIKVKWETGAICFECVCGKQLKLFKNGQKRKCECGKEYIFICQASLIPEKKIDKD